jgi:hypothetical protein
MMRLVLVVVMFATAEAQGKGQQNARNTEDPTFTPTKMPTSIPIEAPMTITPPQTCVKSGCPSEQFIEPILMGAALFMLTVSRHVSACFRSCVQSAKSGGQPVHVSEEATRDCNFYFDIRSFSAFCQNKGGKKPPPFFFKYQSSSYTDLFGSVGRGVIGKTWRHAVLSAIWAGILEWGLFFLKCRHKNADGTDRIDINFYRDLTEILGGVVDVQGQLLSLVSFLLAIYVEGRMSKHQEITKSCWTLRGKLINFTVVAGALIDNGSQENLEVKYQLWRYLNLLHFTVYKGICPDQMSQFGPDHWIKKELLLPHEKEALTKSKLPVETIVGWIATLVSCYTKKDISTDGYVSTTLVKKIVEIRAAASGLVDTCTWLPPISQAQLLAVIVEFFIAITPMALVIKQKEAANPSYVWSMAGSACLSLFFMGLLNMVRIVEDPFGDDLDDLNPDGLLVKTETQCQSFLLAVAPSNEEDWKPGDTGKSKHELELERQEKIKVHSLRPHSGKQSYQISVRTGHSHFAGTDAGVWVKLFGDMQPAPMHLTLENSESNPNAFEDGQRDVFTFKDLEWLGELSKIQIGHDGRGFRAGWTLDSVEITEVTTRRAWFCKCGETIDHGRHDDGWRELTCVLQDMGAEPVEPIVAAADKKAALNTNQGGTSKDLMDSVVRRHEKQMKLVSDFANRLESSIAQIAGHLHDFAQQQEQLDNRVDLVAQWLAGLEMTIHH